MARSPTFFAVPAGTRQAECRSCGAEIYWIKTANDKNMPVDCDEDGGHAPTDKEKGLGVSHFATCPNASQHRKPR